MKIFRENKLQNSRRKFLEFYRVRIILILISHSCSVIILKQMEILLITHTKRIHHLKIVKFKIPINVIFLPYYFAQVYFLLHLSLHKVPVSYLKIILHPNVLYAWCISHTKNTWDERWKAKKFWHWYQNFPNQLDNNHLSLNKFAYSPPPLCLSIQTFTYKIKSRIIVITVCMSTRFSVTWYW